MGLSYSPPCPYRLEAAASEPAASASAPRGSSNTSPGLGRHILGPSGRLVTRLPAAVGGIDVAVAAAVGSIGSLAAFVARTLDA